MTTTTEHAVGQVISLRSTWGPQVRLKCAICTRYLGCRKGRVECRCGTDYSPTKTAGNYKIVRLPHG